MDKNLKLHDFDFGSFMEAVDMCKGDVYLETTDGDVLNLKSKLCQILGIANILKGTSVDEITIRCTNPEDESLMFRFNLYRELPKDEQ